MAEQNNFQQKLGTVSLSTRRVSLEDAFDSNESSWSDSDSENEEERKKVQSKYQIQDSPEKLSSKADSKGIVASSPVKGSRSYLYEPNPPSMSPSEKLFTSERKTIADRMTEKETFQLTSAKEDLKSEKKPLNTPSPAAAPLSSKIGDGDKNSNNIGMYDMDDDDWDDEYNAKSDSGGKEKDVGGSPVASSTDKAERISSPFEFKLRQDAIDWSASESEPGDESDNEPPAPVPVKREEKGLEDQPEPQNTAESDIGRVKDPEYSQKVTRNDKKVIAAPEVKETPRTSPNPSKSPSPIVKKAAEKVEEKEASSLMPVKYSAVSLDNISDSIKLQPERDKASPCPSGLFRASSATSEIRATPSIFLASSGRSLVPKSSSESHFDDIISTSTVGTPGKRAMSTMEIARSIESEPEFGLPPKKVPSTKSFLSRFLLCDNKSGTPKSPYLKKPLMPTPYSTLLLGTPVPVTSSHPSTAEDDPEMKHSMSTSTQSVASSSRSKKRKGILRKFKKTFGVRSESPLRGPSDSSKDSSFSPLADPAATSSTTHHLDDPGSYSTSVKARGRRSSNEAVLDLLNRASSSLEEGLLSTRQGAGDNENAHPREFVKASEIRSRINSNSAPSRSSIRNSDISQRDRALLDERGNLVKRDMSHYCEQAEENNTNRNIIYALLDDFRCVIDKSFGENDRLQTDCGRMFQDVERLQCEVQCLLKMRIDMQQRIDELTSENERLQLCIEEQCQARENLENITKQLSEQIERQDEMIGNLNQEKSELIGCAKQLELDMGSFRNRCTDLENEKDDLTRNLQGFDMSRSKCSDLQGALAECCERCDNLLKENYSLRQQIRDLNGCLDTCCFEKSQMVGDREKAELKCQEDKDLLEGKIAQLMAEKAGFEETKANICRKLNEAIHAHHEELDRLKNEADFFKNQFGEVKRSRDELAARLRACEDKRSVFVPSGPLPTDACAELRRQLSISNSKVQKFQALYEKESAERKDLEKKNVECSKEKSVVETKLAAAERRKTREGSTGSGGSQE